MTQKKNPLMIAYVSNGTFSSMGSLYQDYISLALKGFTYEYKEHLELVKSFDLSSNRLGGEIPTEMSCLNGLVSLNLSRNHLMGSITPNIGQLKSLESLHLSDNHLSGDIPEALSELNFLDTLSLANNNLSWRIPSGTQIHGFNASVFVGNPRLCGDPLPKKCIGVKVDCNSEKNNLKPENGDRIVSLGLYISIALGFITGFWCVWCSCVQQILEICLFWLLDSYVRQDLCAHCCEDGCNQKMDLNFILRIPFSCSA